MLSVFIDPGHGGDELGAKKTVSDPLFKFTGPSIWRTYFEKDINLELSLMLKDVLEACGVTVNMSRTTDIRVDFDDRVNLAIESEADVFISIHHNSSNPFKSGTMAFYPGLERHGERAFDSLTLAGLINGLVSDNAKLKNLGIHEGNFQVLNKIMDQNPSMLAILTETGYMGGDIRFLRNSDNLQQIAYNIAAGLLIFDAILNEYD